MLVIDAWCEDHYENEETILGISQKIVSVTTSYAILNRILFIFVNFYYPIFISVHMKYQLVLSKGGIFETIFYCIATRYSLSIEQRLLKNQFISSTDDTNFSWCSKCGGGNYDLNVIFHLKEKRVLF